jgi:type II secretory pathway pseudopilin PulG
MYKQINHPSKKSFSKRRHPKSTSAFTMNELLVVLMLLMFVSTMAFPSYQAMMKRGKDWDIATELTHFINRTKEQAQRRTRAYQIELDQFNQGTPSGILRIYENATSSCDRIIETPADVSLIKSEPFGQTQVDNRKSRRPEIGLSGWRQGRVGAFAPQPLRICVGIDGAFFILKGNRFVPLASLVQISIQAFDIDQLAVSGPPRIIDISYGSGAILRSDSPN